MKINIQFIYDDKRHLICYPYSVWNLHKMAKQLDINPCWFHKTHYDIPKKRIEEILVTSTRNIILIKNGCKIL
jgi:hypothetical protein